MATNTETGQKIAGKIERLCRAKEITIAQFERDLKLSHGYVRKLKIGQVPSVDRLSMMADYLGVANEFLLGEVSSLSNEKKGAGVVIPLFATIKIGIPLEQNEVIGEELIPDSLANRDAKFAFKINNDLMAPYICKFDRVIVSTSFEKEWFGPDRILLISAGHCDAVCAQVRQNESGGSWLIYANPIYGAIFHEEDDIKIIGEVIEVRRTV